jgi:hypothetical protein
MRRTLVNKPDGRYLLLYDFSQEAPVKLPDKADRASKPQAKAKRAEKRLKSIGRRRR